MPGLIDFGSRALLTLSVLSSKTSVRILIALLEAIERYDALKIISTDRFFSMIYRAECASSYPPERTCTVTRVWRCGTVV